MSFRPEVSYVCRRQRLLPPFPSLTELFLGCTIMSYLSSVSDSGLLGESHLIE